MHPDCTPSTYWQCIALVARFWARVAFSEGCWEWTGCLNHGGYGVGVDLDGKARLAHRIAYAISTGEDPGLLLVCHRCDNRKCVRPDHLFLGSHLENNQDMIAKGRGAGGAARYARIRPDRVPRGERHGRAKLNEAQVAAIRERYATGLVTQAVLATEYGVTPTTIGGIVRGIEWKHI